MNLQRTNAVGFAARPARTPSDELQHAGLHPSDPRWNFALDALKAADPATRPRHAARFGTLPQPIPIPANDSLDTSKAPPFLCDAVDSLHKSLDGVPWSIRAEMLRRWWASELPDIVRTILTVTLVLQREGAPEIGCVEQAFFYSISFHPAWRAAAVLYLEPHRDTWYADWLEPRQEFRLVAMQARSRMHDLPSWLSGPTPK